MMEMSEDCYAYVRHPGEGRDPATFRHHERKTLGPGVRRDDGGY